MGSLWLTTCSIPSCGASRCPSCCSSGNSVTTSEGRDRFGGVCLRSLLPRMQCVLVLWITAVSLARKCTSQVRIGILQLQAGLLTRAAGCSSPHTIHYQYFSIRFATALDILTDVCSKSKSITFQSLYLSRADQVQSSWYRPTSCGIYRSACRRSSPLLASSP